MKHSWSNFCQKYFDGLKRTTVFCVKLTYILTSYCELNLKVRFIEKKSTACSSVTVSRQTSEFVRHKFYSMNRLLKKNNQEYDESV